MNTMSFDYIIIGGGTAGLVLAARLTESLRITVCVLEAGSNRVTDPLILTPGLSNAMIDNPEYDWMFVTSPQQNVNSRQFAWPRGKVLGGTSAINGCMLSHPSKRDLDSWEALGNPGWNFESLAPYYRKFETYHTPSAEGEEYLDSGHMDPQLHSTEGPIQVSLSDVKDTVKNVWTKTCLGTGLPAPRDPRIGVSRGGFIQAVSIDPEMRTRSYAGNAYFAPNAQQENLRVITEAMVQKINFLDTRVGLVTAESVTYTLDGKQYTVNAKKEVILCAGTIQSPQLLELSGIGDGELLRRFGIDPVVENENVGENLQDHVIAPMAWQVKEGVRTLDELREPEKLQQALSDYAIEKSGPLADKLTCVAFVSGPQFLQSLSIDGIPAQIEDLCTSTSETARNAGTAKQLKILKRYLNDPEQAPLFIVAASVGGDFTKAAQGSGIFNVDSPGGFITTLNGLSYPFSLGNIHIQSDSISNHPLINPDYLSHPLNIHLLAAATVFAQKPGETQPLASLLMDSGKVPQPSYKIPRAEEMEKVKEQVKRNMSTEYHHVGTCAMLLREDGGVVDAELRVYGTRNLRVVDASIFPLHVQGNIQSTVYAVAERTADLIKESWGEV